MAGLADRAERAAAALLEDGESLVAVAAVDPRNTGHHVRIREAGEGPHPVDGAADLPAFPVIRQMVVGVSDRRILVWQRADVPARPVRLLADLPRRVVQRAEVDPDRRAPAVLLELATGFRLELVTPSASDAEALARALDAGT